MTNLMRMRFGDFPFPANPAELTVTLSAAAEETVSPFSGAAVRLLARRCRRVAGKGWFTGPDAMTRYLALEEKFGETDTLFLPGRVPFPAMLTELRLIGVQDKDVVGFSFEFSEAAAPPKNHSGTVRRAAGGESLWDIARETGASVEDLMAKNPRLACITELSAGDEVTVP